MSRKRTVADWRAAVYKHRGISNGTRVLLLILADHMRLDGSVSRSRTQLADDLGVSARRITERVSEAHGAALLDTIVAGKPGTTAVYKMLFPAHGADVRIMTKTAPSHGADVRTKLARLHGADVGPPTTYVGDTSSSSSPTATTSAAADRDDERRSSKSKTSLTDDEREAALDYIAKQLPSVKSPSGYLRWLEKPANAEAYQDFIGDYRRKKPKPDVWELIENQPRFCDRCDSVHSPRVTCQEYDRTINPWKYSA